MDADLLREFELRDYEVLPGRLDDWLAAWRRSVVPLRQKCGFEIVGAWLDREGDRFVWILSQSGTESFDAADEQYHALPERRALNPEPSSYLASTRITRVRRYPSVRNNLY